MAVGIPLELQQVLTASHSQLLRLDLPPRQESRTCHRAAIRAMAVVRDDELVRQFET
jgi:hypothetical protein